MTESGKKDQSLGAELAVALAVNDDEAFLQRVMASADERGLFNEPELWDVLEMWARPGLAVAATAAILFAGAFLARGETEQPMASIAEGLSSEVAATEMAEPAPPNPESMLAVAFAIE